MRNLRFTKIFTIIFICLLFICVIFNTVLQSQTAPYAVGDNIIRDIKLQTELMNIQLDVDKIFRSKPTLLVAAVSTCPHCNHEMDMLQRVYKDYYGLFNIIIALADWNNVEKLRKKYGDTFIYIPITITNLKKVNSVPYNVFADRNGYVVDTHRGALSEKLFVEKIKNIIK